jgi:hypothetical protein
MEDKKDARSAPLPRTGPLAALVPLTVSWLRVLLCAERDWAMVTDADSPLHAPHRLSTSTLFLPAVLLRRFRPSAAATRERDLGASALHLAAPLPPHTFWIFGMIYLWKWNPNYSSVAYRNYGFMNVCGH